MKIPFKDIQLSLEDIKWNIKKKKCVIDRLGTTRNEAAQSDFGDNQIRQLDSFS